MDLAEALAQHKASNYLVAEQAYIKLLSNDASNADIHHLLAILYGQQNQLEQAEQHITKALELNPTSPSFYNSCANIKKYQSDFENAVKFYQKSLELNPNNPAAHYNLGLINIQLQKSEAAIENLETAIKQKHDYDDAYITLTQHLFEAGKIDKAIKLLDKSKKHNFNNAKFIKLNALKYQHQGKIENAIAELEKYIAINPNDYSGYHYLAAAELSQGKIQEATSNYLRALDLKEDHHKSHHNIAVIYLTQNKLDLALKHWLRAISYEMNIDYLYNTAVVYNYKGQYSNALTYFEKCLEYDARHYNSIANIAVIYLKKNMPVEAKFYFRKALEIKPDDEQNLYMLSALDNNQESFTAAPKSYVTDLFDQYANTFDEHLTKVLQYDAPNVIYNLLCKYNNFENSKDLTICDIGCGTGFMGKKLYEHAKELEGVDLASKMLEKAKDKNIYTKLEQSDICEYLMNNIAKYDYITAADVIPYFGDLKDIFNAAHTALKTNSYFVFSVEKSDDIDYQLQPNGRFNHKDTYVTALAAISGFEIIANEEHSTRKEGTTAINCNIFLFKKIT